MKKAVGVIVVLVVLAAAAVLIWQFTRSGEEIPAPAPESAPLAPPAAEEPAEAEPPAKPEEEESAEALPDVVAELPEPADLSGALVPAPAQKEPDILDERCREILDAMKEKFGWEKIETMQCNMTMEMGETASVKARLTMEMPNKMLNLMDISVKGQEMTMYQVSDGVFMEMGMVMPDGTRSPMNFKEMTEADGSMKPMFTGEMFDKKTYAYTEAVDYTADPSDPIFQKEGGAPIDNLNLVVLKGQKDDQSLDMFVDPDSLQMVAMRVYKKGEPLMELSGMKYENIADGIIYPVTYSRKMNLSAMGAPGNVPEMQMNMKMSDFVVNDPIDPSTFHFTKDAKQ